MGREISSNHTPITPAECGEQISRLLVHFWDVQLSQESTNRLHADWYSIIKDHSQKTVSDSCRDWLAEGKRKPLPSDILAICNETDETPQILSRLRILHALPVKEPLTQEEGAKEELAGDPIQLGKMIKYAQDKGYAFSYRDQMAYLNQGIQPTWASFMPIENKKENTHVPSREELLAQMSPEARVMAIK